MLQLRAGQPSKYKNKTKPKQNLGSLRGFGKVKQSSEWQMIIKSCKSAVLEKMQTGFRVKKPGWQLSSSTDDLTLVYGLCWGYSLPEVILFTGWAFSQWNRLLPGKRGPVLLWWLLVASVAPEWLPASYPSSPNTWVLSAETAQLLSLRIFLSGWFPSFLPSPRSGQTTLWIPWGWGGSRMQVPILTLVKSILGQLSHPSTRPQERRYSTSLFSPRS